MMPATTASHPARRINRSVSRRRTDSDPSHEGEHREREKPERGGRHPEDDESVGQAKSLAAAQEDNQP
ncbi:MAG: hypothetical protein IIC02_10735 [Planctomycetes bacterium]|nr:hypothetical protein [Planctomycetota bacterium]